MFYDSRKWSSLTARTVTEIHFHIFTDRIFQLVPVTLPGGEADCDMTAFRRFFQKQGKATSRNSKLALWFVNWNLYSVGVHFFIQSL